MKEKINRKNEKKITNERESIRFEVTLSNNPSANTGHDVKQTL